MVENVRTPEVHVRFEGRSYDTSFADLDIGDLSSDAEVREKVAAHLEAPPAKLANYEVDRNDETGDITLRPQAVFGVVA